MDKSLGERVAEEVRAEAARQGITSQSALARLAGMSQPTVRRYFWSVERDVTLDALLQVSAALGVSAAELVARAETPEPKVRRTSARRVPTTERQPHAAD